MKAIKNDKRIFNILMTALITVAMVAGLALPLNADTSSAAAKNPTFSNKDKIKAKLTPLEKKGLTMNLRLEAGLPVSGCDTVQGSCYHKGYIYYTLWDRVNDVSRIVKMRRTNFRVVKISAPLRLGHANDMTANTRNGKLVICHSNDNAKNEKTSKLVSVVNSRTLTIEKTVYVGIPTGVPGIDWDRINDKGGYKGFNSIAYNHKYNQYVVQNYSTRDFMFLNSNFKPVRYVTPSHWDSQTYQGMDSFGNRIVVCNSYKGNKRDNVLSVYDWKGNYLSRVKLNRGEELESLFHVGNKLYATYYTSYYAGYQWVIKTKKINKKVSKNHKKKITEKYYAKKRGIFKWFLNRDGKIYRVTNL